MCGGIRFEFERYWALIHDGSAALRWRGAAMLSCRRSAPRHHLGRPASDASVSTYLKRGRTLHPISTEHRNANQPLATPICGDRLGPSPVPTIRRGAASKTYLPGDWYALIGCINRFRVILANGHPGTCPPVGG